MANKKITELTEIISAGLNDVLPIVDLVSVETKKIKVSGLKASMNLVRGDVGLDQVDNTSDINKPISSLTQTALNSKADASSVYTKVQSDINYEPKNSNIQNHISSTLNPHNVTKTQVGLSNVDNTSDINKPISSATQTALNSSNTRITNIEQNYRYNFLQDTIILNFSDISNGYVDLNKIAVHNSLISFLNRNNIFNSSDFTLIDIGSYTRVTFTGDLLPLGPLALQVGDILRFYYVEKQI